MSGFFFATYLLHSSQLPLLLRLRNFENQVGRDALGDDQDDQHDDRVEMIILIVLILMIVMIVDRDVRNDRDDCIDRDDCNDDCDNEPYSVKKKIIILSL